MPALSERKIAIVRTLVETAPDKIVGGLKTALAQTAADSLLGSVRQLVDAEFHDRSLRNLILLPIAPMCVGAGDDPRKLTFPAQALALIWRGLRASHNEQIEQVRHDLDANAAAQLFATAFNELGAAAAEGLRTREAPDFRAAAEACDQARAGAEMLAACLDLGPVVRQATLRLADWLATPGGDTTAAARLAYKDAVGVSEEAGSRFFQMLAAQMAQPWMVLRIISAVMDKPTERYLRDSELAGFAEALLADIDATLDAIAGMKADEGPKAGRDAAGMAELVVQQITELEDCVDLTRESGWGARVVKQRANLASVVEGRLREAEKAVTEALPMHTPRHQRLRRPIPRLGDPPQDRLTNRALTLLTFSEELRSTANRGGFSATRNKLIDTLGEYLDLYVEEVVDLARTDECESLENARAFMDIASRFLGLVRDAKAADMVRRRAHAAIYPDPSAFNARD